MTAERLLYRVLSWLSPSFPVGGYSYSHGIETAVELGLVTDAQNLADWIDTILRYGAGRIDAGLFRFAWEAVIDEDEEAFARIAERADALMGTSELALESRNQGLAFISTVRAAWLQLELRPWTSVLKTIGRQPRYAVAVAMVTAVARVPLRSALTAFVHAFAANLVSAGVRLIPLGQTDGQRVVAILETAVSDTVDLALSCSPENFGSATPVVDWTSMRHETQYTRLFRS